MTIKNNTYFLIFKGTNKNLAKIEFETLWKTYFNEEIKINQIHNTIFNFKTKSLIKSTDKFLKRLTFTNHISLCKFKGNYKTFQKEISNLNLEKYNNKKFAVRTKRIRKTFEIKINSKILAKPIYNYLKNPKVDLVNFDIEFYFFFEDENNFYFCYKIYENNKDYLRRMPKLRPIVMPYTLKSDMARASINLLELKKGIILDPFCGIGGILLEGYDMNFKIIGNDISWNDLKYFKENFKYYYPNSNYFRTLCDSTNLFLKENSIDGIVTDIPYGKSSRKIGENIYENFLKCAKIYLKPNKKLIIIYANFVEFKKITLKYFDEIETINQYINKSMTRHILILKNNK